MTSSAPDTFPKLLVEHARLPTEPPRKPRERLRNLAELDLGASRRRGRGTRLRSVRDGVYPWRQARDHRRQPSEALPGDRRDAGAGRGAGADLSGLDR